MYCIKCGNQLNENETVCSKCGNDMSNLNQPVMQTSGGNVYRQQNQNTNTTQQMNNSVNNKQKKKISFGKIYGCVVLIGIGFFFAMTILEVILAMATGIRFPRIITSMKVLISMFSIMFGWVPALIITSNNGGK